jgi:hypothetical protein
MVEIDEGLVRLCQQHLPEMHQGSFASPRATLIFEDGATFLRRSPPGVYDVVVVDGIDFGDGEKVADYGNALFSREFYLDAFRALRTGGVFAQYMSDQESSAIADLRNVGFDETLSLGADIDSFYGAGARFALAAKGVSEPLHPRLLRLIQQRKHAWASLSPGALRLGLGHTARRLKGGSAGGMSRSARASSPGARTATRVAAGTTAAFTTVILLRSHYRRRYGTYDKCSDTDECCLRGDQAAIAASCRQNIATDCSLCPTDANFTNAARITDLAGATCKNNEQCCHECLACEDESCMNNIAGCKNFTADAFEECLWVPEGSSSVGRVSPVYLVFLIQVTLMQ